MHLANPRVGHTFMLQVSFRLIDLQWTHCSYSRNIYRGLVNGTKLAVIAVGSLVVEALMPKCTYMTLHTNARLHLTLLITVFFFLLYNGSQVNYTTLNINSLPMSVVTVHLFSSGTNCKCL